MMPSQRTPPGRRAEPSRLVGVLLFLAAFSVLSCGEEEFKRTSRRGAPGAKSAMSANLKSLGKPSVELIEERKEKGKKPKARKKKRKRRKGGLRLPKPSTFTEVDFVESNENSRDPFRIIQEEAATKTSELDPSDLVYLKDHPIDKLVITGIVGKRRRYAMVLDPAKGKSTIIRTRDKLAKERLTVFEILSDRVILTVENCPKAKDPKKDDCKPVTKFVDEARRASAISGDALRPDESGIRYSTRRRPRY